MEDFLVFTNPNVEERKEIIRRIKENGGYCPCRFEKTPDTKCRCKEFRETLNCICGLYVKVPCREVEREESHAGNS